MTKPIAGGPRRLRAMRYPLRTLRFAFVLLLAACSASPAASPPPTAGPPAASTAPSASLTVRPTGTAPDYTGILSIDAIEGGCAYLQAANGDKLQVLYPDGWALDKDPLELIAPDGSVHAKAGDRVSIMGSDTGDMASICQIGPIIQATEVLDR